MPFYRDHIYPHLVSVLGDPKSIQEVRQRIIPLAQGEVLEIGVGPGVNFVHYDPARVSRIYALEPNPGMIRLAEQQRRQTQVKIEFLDLPGERIPLEDRSVDTVVSTFTRCTIPGVVEAIRGMGRVLRPGGMFLFFEHGRAPDPRVQRWQTRSEPIAHWLFEGCPVTRDIPSLITSGGFQMEQIEGLLSSIPEVVDVLFLGRRDSANSIDLVATPTSTGESDGIDETPYAQNALANLAKHSCKSPERKG